MTWDGMVTSSAPVVACSCAEGWKPEGWAYCAECYEGKIERLNRDLEHAKAMQEVWMNRARKAEAVTSQDGATP